MPSPAPAPCLHELRPGTKVCLHCRRAEREARAAHRNRILVRITLTGMAIAIGVVGVRAGIEAFKAGSLPQIPILMAATTKAIVESLPGAPAAPPAPVAVAPSVSGPAVPDSASGIAIATDSAAAPSPAAGTLPVIETVALTTPGPTPHSAPAPASLVPPAPAALLPPPPAPAPATPAIVPVVPEGRTELAGGMFALRSGDTVTVHFDTPDARTRRPERFEQLVRSTLPLAYGAAAEALLASVAPGALVGAVDLVTELPTRGLHLRASDGRALSIWPETRPGRDGPLVISYRATLAR